MINHVFFSDGQFESIRRRAQTDAHVRTLTELVLNDAKHTDDIGALAFAYYYNGDEDCAVRAHRRMIALLDDPRWENSDFTSTDLHTAALCEQMAVAYSLFADVIDQEDRRHLALETWKRGIAPILREWTAPGYRCMPLIRWGITGGPFVYHRVHLPPLSCWRIFWLGVCRRPKTFCRRQSTDLPHGLPIREIR